MRTRHPFSFARFALASPVALAPGETRGANATPLTDAYELEAALASRFTPAAKCKKLMASARILVASGQIDRLR